MRRRAVANTNGSSGARDPEEQENELMATLKAARELGPDMDKAVVASYLEKQKQHAAAQAQAQKPQPQQAVVAAPGQQRRPMFLLGLPIGLIVFIAILIATQGQAWWMFWVLFCFGGWSWWGWGHDDHMQRRMNRYEWRRARLDARYGYGPYDRGNGSAPVQPPTQPAQVPPPQTPEYD